jgi:hypothetical protein
MIWRLIKYNIFGNLFRPLQTKDIVEGKQFNNPHHFQHQVFHSKLKNWQWVKCHVNMFICMYIKEINVSVEALQLIVYT